jgi:hypothetical protein
MRESQNRKAEAPFREPVRELGVTASLEKRVLLWLAERIPSGVSSDHMTAMGLLAMVLGGALYALSGRWPALLLAVNGCLLLNWLGDSLDGTLARFRRLERPRFGFYVDHVVDALGAACLIGGLGLSTLMSPGVAAVLLLAYYLLSIDISLATYALGRFRISFAGVGGTELRLALAGLNLAVLWWPEVTVFGTALRLFDVVGAAAALALLATLLRSILGNTRQLLALERARHSVDTWHREGRRAAEHSGWLPG